MRESGLGPAPAPFPTDLHAVLHAEWRALARLHAGAGIDAESREQLCVANAVINSRKKSEFPLFSSMSLCKFASIAKGSERMRGVCKDCCLVAEMVRTETGLP